MTTEVPILKRKRETAAEPTPTAAAMPPRSGGEEVEFDWRRTFNILLKKKRFILSWILAMLVLGIVFMILFPPTYKAGGLIQIESDKDSTRPANVTGDQSISYDISGNSMLTDGEIAVLQSRMVLLEVIKQLNLLVDARPNTFPIIGNAIFRFNSDADQPVEVPDMLRHFAWGGEHIEVPTFDVPGGLKNKKFIVRVTEDGYDLMNPDGDLVLRGKLGVLATKGKISILVKRLDGRWGTTFKLYAVSPEEALEKLSDHLTAEEKVKDSGVIDVSFKGKDPTVVAAIINNLEEIYLKRNIEWRAARAEELEQTLRSQLPRLREQVEIAQQQLNAYQLQHGSVDVTQETQLLLQRGGELQTARLALTQEREEAVQRFTGKHPMVAGIDEKLNSIDGELQKLKSQSTKLPTTQQEMLNRTRDLDIANQLYTAMLNTIQQQQVIEAGTLGSSRGNVRIVDGALLPEKPSFPKLKIILPASLFLGVMIGVGLILARHFFVNPIHDESDIETRLGLRVLGRVPFSRLQNKLTKRLRKQKSPGELLARTAPEDPAIEALRALRSSVFHAVNSSRNNVVVVTGPCASTGKSFTAINLAALLALSGKRTVIIDADLTNGSLYKLTNLDSSPGLTDYIMEAVAPGGILQPTDIPGLTLIAQGSRRANSGELLMHELFGHLLAFLSTRYDHIIIDTPNNLTASTAGTIARLAGCTLLVLKSGAHPLHQVEESVLRMTYSGASVRGVIFNEV